MRNTHLFLVLFIGIISSAANAQQFGIEHRIVGKTTDGNSFCHGDIDNDGDIDFITGGEHKISILFNQGADLYTSTDFNEIPEELICSYIELADLNGDNSLDMITVQRNSSTSNKIVWYANDGTGVFGPENFITSGTSVNRFEVSDLDGDLDLDIVSMKSNPWDSFQVWGNDGIGGFSSAGSLGFSTSYLQDLECADITGNGFPDIVCCALEDDIIAVYENQGGLSFGSETFITNESDYPRSIGLGDLDGDSKIDIVCASYNDDKISFYKNTGDGTYLPGVVLSPTLEEARSVKLVDINDDGHIDVFASGTEDNIYIVLWYENNGDGTFAEGEQISDEYAISISAADIDNDGDLDPIINSYVPGGQVLFSFPQDEAGEFNQKVNLSRTLASGESSHHGDFDGDGWEDILSCSSRDNNISWHRNLGNGTFSNPKLVSDSANMVSSIIAADLDNDGDLDVVAAAPGISGGIDNNMIKIFENDGLGNFNIASQYDYYFSSTPIRNTVHVGDVNGDGLVDIFTMDFHPGTSNNIKMLTNLGGLNFTDPQIAITITFSDDWVQNLELVDMDADNDLDIIYYSPGSNYVRWFKNDGIGDFTEEGGYFDDFGTFNRGISMAVGELNGDEAPDIILSMRTNFTSYQEASLKMVYLLNDGLGNFGGFENEVMIDEYYGLMRDIEIGDIDGDGDNDIAAIRLDNITWYRNDGGDFSYSEGLGLDYPIGIPVGDNAGDNLSNRALHLVDLDNDSDKDIFYIEIENSGPKNQIIWHKNQLVDCEIIPELTANSSTTICEGEEITLSVNVGDSFDWNEGLTDQAEHTVTPSESATYTVTVSSGESCIYATSIHVEVNPNFAGEESISICSGGNHIFPDGFEMTNITSPTEHISMLLSTEGCDSIITSSISILESFESSHDAIICNGESYTFPDGQVQENITADVEYISTLTAQNECDSLVTTYLSISPTYASDENTSICSGEDYTFPDGTMMANITSAITHDSYLQSQFDCDSIVTTSIAILPNYEIDQENSVCIGGSFTFPDGTTIENIQTDTSHTSYLESIDLCDSIISTSITILPHYTIDQENSVCSGESFTFPDGTTLENIQADTTHISYLETVSFCDSILTTSITVVQIDIAVEVDGNQLSANQNGADYQWIDCSNFEDISDATNSNYSPEITGSYAVEISLDGCSDISDCYDITVINIGEKSLEDIINYYPNPVHDEFNIDLSQTFENVNLKVFELGGRLVMDETYFNTNAIRNNMSTLSSGEYILQLELGEESLQIQIIKE